MTIDTQIAASTINLLAEFAKVGSAQTNTCRDLQRRIWASTGLTNTSSASYDAWKEANPEAAKACSKLMFSAIKHKAADRRAIRTEAHGLLIKAVS